MSKFSRVNSSTGATLVEFAIFLLLIAVIFPPFWDLVVDRLAISRAISAAIQISLTPTTPPLSASIKKDLTTFELSDVQVSKIGLTNFKDLVGTSDTGEGVCQGLLPKINAKFNLIMANSGSGAAVSSHNIALRLVYFDICTDTLSSCSTKPKGSAWQALVAGDGPEYLSACGGVACAQPFFTQPGGVSCASASTPDACFGAPGSPTYEKIRSEFDAYVTAQTSKILSPDPALLSVDPAAGAPEFGTQIVDVPGVAGIAPIKVYSSIKPVMFMALCVDPPTFWAKTPSYKFMTYFFDSELGFGAT